MEGLVVITFMNQRCRLTLVSLVCFLLMIPSYGIAAPLPISLIRITVGYEKTTSTVWISGGADSVQSGAEVWVKNRSTRKTFKAISNGDGSFYLPLYGREGDNLSVWVKDNTGSSPIMGLSVLADPAMTGPYPVGTLVLDDPNGFPDFTNPLSTSNEPVPLAWARIMYPATNDGGIVPNQEGLLPNAPVSSSGPFPVVVFLHGRHVNCDADGDSGISDIQGSFLVNCNDDSQRIPSHEGFNYLMKKLASHGVTSISISSHELQANSSYPRTRGQLVLRFLDLLREWNNIQIKNGLAMGTAPFSDLGGRTLDRLMFKNKFDLGKIGLCGHSLGGSGVGAAQVVNLERALIDQHNILAICSMAPSHESPYEESYHIKKGTFFLLHGSRDADNSPSEGFRVYDVAYPDTQDSVHLAYPKMAAVLYGANHNYFNTIWTDEQDAETWPVSAYPQGNPWAGAKDESSITPKMTAADQRSIALSSIVAFFRWQLQGADGYRQVLTGNYRFPTVRNSEVFRTYQHAMPDSITPERKIVDNFQQWGSLDFQNWAINPMTNGAGQPYLNTLGEVVSIGGFAIFGECPFFGACFAFNQNGVSLTSVSHYATIGLKLGWTGPQIYASTLPLGHKNVSTYGYLTFRAAETIPAGTTPPPAPRVSLIVGLEDGTGRRGEVRADRYGLVPVPYSRGTYMESLMASTRIPLTHFQLNNSGVDLTDIRKIIITTEGTGNIGLDDIEFSN
jgi:hypothetical protein